MLYSRASKTSIGAGLIQAWQNLWHPQPITPEYRQWCQRLLRQRFWLGLGLSIAYISCAGLAEFYETFINPRELLQAIQSNQINLQLSQIQQNFFLHKVVIAVSLSLLALLWRGGWGRRHAKLMAILLSWSVSFFPDLVLGAILGIPRFPSTITFLAQAVIVPVHWRLHFIAQLVPILFYFFVYPSLGLSRIGLYSLYSFSYTAEIVLVCIICLVGVYVFEQSKQSELKAIQHLQLFIHSITHDLRTPIMGALMLLQSIDQNTPAAQAIQLSRSEMAQLIQGNKRLLGLMNALLVPQDILQTEFGLERQDIYLHELAATVSQELQPTLQQHRVMLCNQIPSNLPLLSLDPQQIERVFTNLIANAITHNPSGTTITLTAQHIPSSLLKISVIDNGVGIPAAEQAALFEPYRRGHQAQYLPGQGLGLYICKQIVLAHGGNIGIHSHGQGTEVWFTLPFTSLSVSASPSASSTANSTVS